MVEPSRKQDSHGIWVNFGGIRKESRKLEVTMPNIKISIPVDYANLIVRVLENHSSSSVHDLRRIGEIVTDIQNKVNRLWNEDYDQNAKCTCGHIYHRHFDGYEDMEPVGCKYCVCWEFNGSV